MKDLTTTSKGSTARTGRGLQGSMPNPMRLFILSITVAGLALMITACGSNVENKQPPTTAVPLTHQVADPNIQYFVDTLYGELISHNCVNCHATNESKSDQPFADPNNPNVAYNSAVSMLGMDPTTLAYLKGLVITDPPVPPSPPTIFQSKVSGGHQPWTSNPTADADKLGLQIIAWATLVQTDGLIDDEPDDTESKLVAPPDDSPRSTIAINSDNRDAQKAVFETTVYPVLRGSGPGTDDPRCSQCHNRNANIPATPYFADDDSDLAFDELVDNDKVNLNKAAASRIYIRLFQDSHNCWSACGPGVAGDDDTVLAAINAWISAPVNQQGQEFDSSAYNNSSALFLSDGQVTSGGVRYDRWVIAKYDFSEGSGLLVNDSSGVAPLLPLTLSSANNCQWLSNYGVVFNDNCQARSQSVAQSLKLYDQIVPRGEYTIEAWIVPNNEAQEGPAVIASYSAGSSARNFTIGQATEYYVFANRNSGMANNGAIVGASNQNAEPQLSVDDGDDDTHFDHVVTTNLQHLVMTYDTVTGRKLYVDGTPVLCETESTSTPLCLQVRAPDNINVVIGNILTWNPGYLFTLGSETNGDNQWRGAIRMLAIHNRALTQAQIKMNFDASVGQKFNLLFSVGDRDTDGDGTNDGTGFTGVPDNSYIWFQVSQYDYYSYLFSSPRFVVLDDAYDPRTITSFNIQRMRIGLNGKEPAVGQAYSRMGPFNDKMPGLIEGSNYMQVPPTPPSTADWTLPPTWSLSTMGTVIAQENGVNGDQFFLTFEVIAGETIERELGVPATLSVTYGAGPAYVVGVRTFNEIIASMGEVTGIDPASFDPPTQEKIAGLDLVSGLKAQMPATETLEGFISTQQMAISTLAGYFCSALVDSANPDGFFGLNNGTLNSPVGSAFPQGPPVNNTNRDLVINNLISKIARQQTGNELATQPEISVIRGELETLANGVDGQGNSIGLMNRCTPTLDDNTTQDCTGSVRTKTIVKAMCMAVLASAAVTQQ